MQDHHFACFSYGCLNFVSVDKLSFFFYTFIHTNIPKHTHTHTCIQTCIKTRPAFPFRILFAQCKHSTPRTSSSLHRLSNELTDQNGLVWKSQPINPSLINQFKCTCWVAVGWFAAPAFFVFPLICMCTEGREKEKERVDLALIKLTAKCLSNKHWCYFYTTSTFLVATKQVRVYWDAQDSRVEKNNSDPFDLKTVYDDISQADGLFSTERNK